MPELPEVEVIRRALVPWVVGRRVTDAAILEPRLTRRRGTPQEVAAATTGRTVAALSRRGKWILFDLGGLTLVIRLGMTGQLLWWDGRSQFRPDAHTHAHFGFAGGGVLSYRDVRKFGEIFLLPTATLESALRIGREPLDPAFSAGALAHLCKESRTRIKTLLLDQRKIAGIGNIYADEALFRAGIRPTRRAPSLRPGEIRALRRSLRAVLQAAIRHRGSSISDYRDPSGTPGDFATRHRVYHRQGEPCMSCGTPIQRVLLGQRGTHFCPACQR